MSFNPKEHITKIQGRDYLETKWREVWFRDEHPTGSIITEVIAMPDFHYVRATVAADGVTLATGMATIRSGERQVWSGRDLEKAETAAIGRALAHAGYGTQFTDDDEGDNLADSPVDKTNGKQTSPAQKTNPSELDIPRLIEAATPMYDAAKHAANSVNKLLADGVIHMTDDPYNAMQAIVLHRAESVYQMDYAAVLMAVQSVNEDEGIGDYRAAFGKAGSHLRIWENIVEYAKLKQTPPAKAKSKAQSFMDDYGLTDDEPSHFIDDGASFQGHDEGVVF